MRAVDPFSGWAVVAVARLQDCSRFSSFLQKLFWKIFCHFDDYSQAYLNGRGFGHVTNRGWVASGSDTPSPPKPFIPVALEFT